ncbi:Serine hydroxymethyltransferase [Frankliniella fusca]|uniref:Serine hydroxymethyltransferase n=1 Tax=Frankliniella fusca TaxID=407009 RepID=A0AAE1LNN9_9NEOP|nr:Serine hydroxymethyltransferase [Frankliniella fusca]
MDSGLHCFNLFDDESTDQEDWGYGDDDYTEDIKEKHPRLVLAERAAELLVEQKYAVASKLSTSCDEPMPSREVTS